MSDINILRVLGPAWEELSVYIINKEPHWLGCEVVELLGLSSTTQAIKGTREKPKVRYPDYRKHMIPEVNKERAVYLLTLDGVIQVIKKNRSKRTKELQRRLTEVGL